MHRLVHAQPLGVRKGDAGLAQFGHLLLIGKREELHKLRLGQRIALLDELREGVAVPGNHHAPCLDTAEAVDALLHRFELHQRVDVKGLLLLHQSGHLHGPWPRVHGAGIPRRIALVRAELVEIVVVRDVLVGRRCLPRQGQGTLHRLQLLRSSSGADISPLVDALCCQRGYAGRHCSCHKRSPIQVVGL